MRLIDADALIAYIDAQKGRPFIGCTIGEALKIMTDEQPTIEPERKTGRWNKYCRMHSGDTFVCDKCGSCFVIFQGSERMNFCPNCGADMRQREE